MPRIPNCNTLNKRQKERRGERVGEGVRAHKRTEGPKAKNEVERNCRVSFKMFIIKV